MQRHLKDEIFVDTNSEHSLIISGKVFNTFKKYEHSKRKTESGGILLGKVYKNYAKILDVTIPNKFDLFGPLFFIRSKIGAQPLINRDWRKTQGTLIYLGEWHTHPEIDPKPSNVDKKMIISSLKKTKMEIDFLYLIIAGYNNTYWIGKQTEKELIELKQRTQNFKE